MASVRTVTSKDGTQIAFDHLGHGPPVILVSGASADRRGNAPLADVLAAEFTVFNYDRRGRGESGETLPYALEREFEDIDALILEAGESAHLYGISSGGALALEAAAAALAINRLAVYEVPYSLDEDQPRLQKEYVRKLEAAARSGRRGNMAEVFLRMMGADEERVAQTRNSPWWPSLEALEHTLAYDAAAMGNGLPPFERLKRIRAPTCVITGAGDHEVGSTEFFESAARAIVGSIPSAEHRVLPGQTHNVDPKVLGLMLTDFYKG